MEIVSLHSQKGGTGKTSIALSLAIEAQRRKLKPLLIDMDLSGTSIKDSIHLKLVNQDQSISEFFRSLVLKNPTDYIATAEIQDLGMGTKEELAVLLGDAQTGIDLMPLVYKENHSQFLRSRVESLINALAKDKLINVVIIDNSPGCWGLGKAVLETVIAGKLTKNNAVTFNGKCILVSSLDLNDIVSCLHLRQKDAQVPYLHVINRSILGDNVDENVKKIADNLDLKGQIDAAYAGYLAHAQTLRKMKVDWVGVEDPDWKSTYHEHVKGIKPPANIAALADKLGWPPHAV